MALLEVKNLTKNFGGLTAVGDVTMELNEGELVGLIGPNGAGKTTLFNLLTGVYEPSEGTITLDGQLLNGKAPYKIAAGGLGRTFQNIRLFKDLSVLDNVLIAFANHHKPHVFASLFRLPSYYKNEEWCFMHHSFFFGKNDVFPVFLFLLPLQPLFLLSDRFLFFHPASCIFLLQSRPG